MPVSDEPTHNKSQITKRTPQASSLESAIGHIAIRASAGDEGNGGGKKFSTPFAAELFAFCEWGDSQKLIRSKQDFPFFQRPPQAVGHEHEVWFDDILGRWFKVTHPPNSFGFAWGKCGSATVGEYLTRLSLQNEYFGDDIELVALIDCSRQLRIVISQPHVDGSAATAPEIQSWFTALRFIQLNCGGSVAWYLKQENLLVADAHEGNVLKTKDGELVPIDLNIIKPSGETFVWVSENCKS